MSGVDEVTELPQACDQCGLSVPYSNDVAVFEAERHDNPFLVFEYAPRHLLPVRDESGAVVCVGSPSRAQYLEGQPLDPSYPYLAELEAPSRAAYEQMQNTRP